LPCPYGFSIARCRRSSGIFSIAYLRAVRDMAFLLRITYSKT